MARGFLNGIVAGGVIGALVAMFVSPQMKPAQKRNLMNKSKKMQTKAQRVMKDMQGSVKGIRKMFD